VLTLPLGAVCVVVPLSGVLQTRGTFAGAGPQAMVGRIKWRAGRMLSREGVVDLLLNFCRLGLLAAMVCWAFASCLSAALGLHGAGASRILAGFGVLAVHLITGLAMVLVGLGVADYLLQMRRHHARMRMSRDEAKREHRENEGIPEHKAERQLRHRELQLESGDLREATLVVVDPGRETVAIAYSSGSRGAPVLIAKGEGLLARRVEALARVEGVPIFVDAEVVRALSSAEVGDEIPESAHVPVAELMVQAERQNRAGGTPFPVGPAP
jgi:flagellar biosynthesis protein FlhB